MSQTESTGASPCACMRCEKSASGFVMRYCAQHEPPAWVAARADLYRRALEYVASLEGPGSTSGRFAAYVLAGGDLDAPHWIAAGEPLAARMTT